MVEEISDLKLKEYREAFDNFDKDHNGSISLKEIHESQNNKVSKF